MERGEKADALLRVPTKKERGRKTVETVKIVVIFSRYAKIFADFVRLSTEILYECGTIFAA